MAKQINKTWVNIFQDYYDPTQLYVSKSYATKGEAMMSIRKSMLKRYITTANLANLLPSL